MMQIRARSTLACLTCLVALVAAPVADAAVAKPITGRLSVQGYTVLAVAANGKVASVRATPGFRLRPPAAQVTLQLRRPDGSYGGPIVVATGSKGMRAIVGVRAGAALGAVRVNRLRGYATARPHVQWLDLTRWARARMGVPIGAGRFGFVKSIRTRGGVPGDRDLDGVADPLDIDANGNRVLDNLDRGATTRTRARSSARAGSSARIDDTSANDAFFSHFMFGPGLDGSVNANAGSTPEQIAAVMPQHGLLALAIAGEGAELDCGGRPDPGNPDGWIGGLPYCTRGGSGRVFGGDFSGQPFPDNVDADRDGFGTMVNNINNPALGSNMFLKPNASADQIGTGDVLIQRVGARELVTTLQYTLATTPALVSYNDRQGNATTVSYPVAPGGPGTASNPFQVKADPATGQVSIDVTLWRPQRRPLPGEPGHSDPPTSWTDVGGLLYEVAFGGDGRLCPQGAYSAFAPGMSAAGTFDPPGLFDTATDRPANAQNVLTFTVNLSTCAASPVTTTPTGLAPAPAAGFGPGDTLSFGFQAASLVNDNGTSANQTVAFKRVS